MDNIIYSTPEQQIEKLRTQQLIINDEEYALHALSSFGYSNLIKSYRDPYIYMSEGKKVYRDGVTFEQITSLYMLDKNLRSTVMAAMIDFEEHIKEAAADIIAKSYGIHQDDYLNFRNYRNKRKHLYQFTLKGLLEKMNNTLNSDKNPIKHYREEHGIVPPWILFKSVYFSTIVNFIDQFKAPQQQEMAEKLYDLVGLGLSSEAGRKLMLDTLFICLEYRNLAAHGGRTYNYQCDSLLRTKDIFGLNMEPIAGFSQLILLLDLLKYHNPYLTLSSGLAREVNQHCKLFPSDMTYLGQILNVNIVMKTNVYISNNSNKYHALPHCSGLKDSKKIELSKAIEKGYVACKRCTDNLT